MNDDLARAGWRQDRQGRWYPPDARPPVIDLRNPTGAGRPAAGDAPAPTVPDPGTVLVRTGLLDAPIVIRRAVVTAEVGTLRRETPPTAAASPPTGAAAPPAPAPDPSPVAGAEVPAAVPVVTSARRSPQRRTLAVAAVLAVAGLTAVGVGVARTVGDDTAGAAPDPVASR